MATKKIAAEIQSIGDGMLALVVSNEDGPFVDYVTPASYAEALAKFREWQSSGEYEFDEAVSLVELREMGIDYEWPDLPDPALSLWSVAWSKSISGAGVLVEAPTAMAAIRKYVTRFVGEAAVVRQLRGERDRARVKLGACIYETIAAEPVEVLR